MAKVIGQNAYILTILLLPIAIETNHYMYIYIVYMYYKQTTSTVA